MTVEKVYDEYISGSGSSATRSDAMPIHNFPPLHSNFETNAENSVYYDQPLLILIYLS